MQDASNGVPIIEITMAINRPMPVVGRSTMPANIQHECRIWIDM